MLFKYSSTCLRAAGRSLADQPFFQESGSQVETVGGARGSNGVAMVDEGRGQYDRQGVLRVEI